MKNKVLVAMGIGISAALVPAVAAVADEAPLDQVSSFDEEKDDTDYNQDGDKKDKVEAVILAPVRKFNDTSEVDLLAEFLHCNPAGYLRRIEPIFFRKCIEQLNPLCMSKRLLCI